MDLNETTTLYKISILLLTLSISHCFSRPKKVLGWKKILFAQHSLSYVTNKQMIHQHVWQMTGHEGRKPNIYVRYVKSIFRLQEFSKIDFLSCCELDSKSTWLLFNQVADEVYFLCMLCYRKHMLTQVWGQGMWSQLLQTFPNVVFVTIHLMN